MRRISIGVQWALRYTLALLVTVSAFGIFTYTQIASRTESDARLVLELQVNEVAVHAAAAEPDEMLETLERGIASADPELKLGFALFDGDGELVVARGSLARYPTPLPAGVLAGEDQSGANQVEVGENYPYLVMAIRAYPGFVQGALYTRPFVRNARDVRDIYLYSLPVLLLLTAGLGYGLARGSLRPLAEMNATARRISGTNLEERIPTTGSRDELDELATTLNDMIARIGRSVERTRRFSGNAAHELRTPLNALRSRLEVTLEQPRDAEEARKALEETAAEVEGLSNVVHAMMRLAQSEAGLAPEQRSMVDLQALLLEVVEFFAPLAEEAEVELVTHLDAPAHLPGDPSWLHELFANLLDNAIKYTPAGGRVELTVERTDDALIVRVQDDGIGVPKEDLTRIFEPFHRVSDRSMAPGVGLGLPISREIARAHGGELSVESHPGEGATFVVQLPVS
ncbi:MAG: HAMP domain-containing protein [Deltaproteobacteria bacterium]|nr:HAMP domain-containing protein [Deltaproteobacteria bacterium]